METQTLINILLAICGTGMAWFCRTMWDSYQKLKDEVHALEVNVKSNYVLRPDFTEALRRIEDLLGKIFDKLDNKVDK